MKKHTEKTIQVARESLEQIRKVLEHHEFDSHDDFSATASAYWKLRNFIALIEKEDQLG